MRGERWSNAARFFTASVVGFLLTAGLCGYGGGFDTHVTDLQVKASYAGSLLFLVSFGIFLAACNEVGKARRDRRHRRRWRP